MSYQDHSKLPTTAQKAALAGSYGTPSSTNEYVTDDDPRLSGESGAVASVAAVALFGSGRDGSATFDGSSAVTGYSLSGSTYTRNVLYDAHHTTITVSNSVTINMAGFRLKAFAATLGNSVRIHNDGYATTTTAFTAAQGADPHIAATTTVGATFFGGSAGGAGRSTSGNGNLGTAISTQVVYGGRGGSGGRGRWGTTTSNGGSGGTKTKDGTASLHFYGDDWEILLGFPYCRDTSGAVAQCAGGTGGGSGGVQISNTATGIGAAGGGGVLGFAIKTLTCGTSCTFSANGGSSTGTPAATNAGVGGPGGGGGGLVVGFIAELNGSNLPSFTANGGNGGTGHANGANAWGEGGYGGLGGKITIFIGTNNVGGTPTVTANGGTKVPT